MENSLIPDDDDFVNFTYDSIYNNNNLDIPQLNNTSNQLEQINIINQITNTEIQKEQANKSLEKFIDLLKCFICFTKVENLMG